MSPLSRAFIDVRILILKLKVIETNVFQLCTHLIISEREEELEDMVPEPGKCRKLY